MTIEDMRPIIDAIISAAAKPWSEATAECRTYWNMRSPAGLRLTAAIMECFDALPKFSVDDSLYVGQRLWEAYLIYPEDSMEANALFCAGMILQEEASEVPAERTSDIFARYNYIIGELKDGSEVTPAALAMMRDELRNELFDGAQDRPVTRHG